MSLPIPNLDDKRFDQLVEEARKLIPGYSTEWTDHNFSDPGITFIDLFAWLSEIALYRINLVNDNHRLKYLKLLGVKPQPAKQAKVDLTFTSEKQITLRKGTEVSTEAKRKEVFFQLEDDIEIIPATLEKIIIEESNSYYDRSGSNERKDLFFAPFGKDIRKDCALYLGFKINTKTNSVVSLNSLNLMCYVYEKDFKEIKKYGTEQAYKIENTGVKWEISTGNEWTPVLLQDETEGFRKSGRIIFKKLKSWKATDNITIMSFEKSYFWLRCVVEDAHYEYPPRIEMIRLNTVSAIHGKKIEDDMEKWISNGLPHQVFKLRETPIVDKTLRLSIDEWIEVQDLYYPVEVQDFCKPSLSAKHYILDRKEGIIKFGNGETGLIPPKGSVITLFKYVSEDGKKESSIAGLEERISDGLKNEYDFSLPTFKLCIEQEKWIEKEDFAKSSPSAKHYVLDRKEGILKFGNGKKGLIPLKGSIISLLIIVSEDEKKEASIAGFEEWISSGLPDQIFRLKETSISRCELELTFKLAVDEKWVKVDDFDRSGPLDKHFILNKEKGNIKFGNGKKGLIPPKCSVITLFKFVSKDEEKEGSIAGFEEWISDGSKSKYDFSLPTFKLSIEKEKWIEVKDFEDSGPYNKHFVLDKKTRELRFGNGKKGLIPPEGSVIVVEHNLKNRGKKVSIVGCENWISSGLPDQIFRLKETLISKCELELTFYLAVDEKWVEVDDFDGSGPSDKHFVLNKEKGEIKFGDGLMGLIPAQDSKIRILNYIIGGGEEGNLITEPKLEGDLISEPKIIWKMDGYEGKIESYLASTGGTEAQTVEEATEDFCRDLKYNYTAITIKDFEEIALNTPGLRIARTKAISNYNHDDPENSTGCVTVIIVPFTYLETLEEPPKPSEEFKKAVHIHLDKHRLIGTDINVISPIYVKVTVSAKVVPMDTFLDDSLIRKKVIEKLNQFLHPIKGGMESKGWPIGRDIYLSEIYSVIEKTEGVNCVLKLSISGNQGVSTDINGNLILNKLASVYSGVHSVEIVRKEYQYFGRGDSYSGK